MSVPVELRDGRNGRKQRVTKDDAGLVSVLPFPPLLQQKIRPFSEYLRDENGSFDMDLVTTPTEFSIPAPEEADRYITGLSFVLAYGATAYLYQFADGTALANGIEIYYIARQGEVHFTGSIKTNLELLRLRQEPLTSDWQARNFAAVNDWGYVGFINLVNFIPPFGVKLDAGTSQRFVVAINDSIAAVADIFNFYARGFERF